MQISWTTIGNLLKKLISAKKPYSLHRVYKDDTSDSRVNLVVGGLALSAFFPLVFKTSTEPFLIILTGFIALLWGITTKVIGQSFILRLLVTLISFIVMYILISGTLSPESKTSVLGNMLPYIISLMFTRICLNKTYLDINKLLLVGLLSLFLSFTLLPSIYIGLWFGVYLVIMALLSGHLLSHQSKIVNKTLPTLWKIYIKILVFSLGFACVFLLVTKFSSLASNHPRTNYGDVAEISTVVTNNTFESRGRSKSTAFRFTLDNKTKEEAPQYWYWKSQILYNYNGSAWTRPPTISALNEKDTKAVELNQDQRDVISYTMTKASARQPLAVLDQPIKNKSVGVYLDGMPYEKQGSPSFDTTISHVYQGNPEAFVMDASHTDSKDNDIILKASLSLPDHMDPRIKQLASKLKEGTTSEKDFVSRIAVYYRDHFSYSLKPAPHEVDSLNPAERFLLETHTGACLDFSGGMILLLRSENIPARLIAGYNGSHWNSYGNYWQVNQNQAHAWVEVWFPEIQAWARVDPTAAVSNVLDRGEELSKWDFFKDYLNDMSSKFEQVDLFHLSKLSSIDLPEFDILGTGGKSSKWLTLSAVGILLILIWRTVFQKRTPATKKDKLLRLIEKKFKKDRLPSKESYEGWHAYQFRISPDLTKESKLALNHLIVHLNQWFYGDGLKDNTEYKHLVKHIRSTKLNKKENIK